MRRGPPWEPVPTPARLLAAQAAADKAAIAALPQGTPGWKAARYGYVSASTAAKAAGLLGPAAQRAWVTDMVWPEYAGLTGFAASMAAVGTANENVAASVYGRHRYEAAGDGLRRLVRQGFQVHPTLPWLGASPDLLIHERADDEAAGRRPPAANPHHLWDPYVVEHPAGAAAFLAGWSEEEAEEEAEAAAAAAATEEDEPRILIGEIKCVAAKHQLFYSANPKHARYGLSVEYYTQIQVLMEVFDLEAADVIVHTKAATQVTRFGRNRAFWAEDLLPALDHAFQTLFLPRLLERAEGRESPPQARPAPSVSSLFAGEGDEGTAAAAAVASGPPAARPGRRPVVAAAQLPASWWTSAPLPLSTAPSTAKK